jgi:hypothetical protein
LKTGGVAHGSADHWNESSSGQQPHRQPIIERHINFCNVLLLLRARSSRKMADARAAPDPGRNIKIQNKNE